MPAKRNPEESVRANIKETRTLRRFQESSTDRDQRTSTDSREFKPNLKETSLRLPAPGRKILTSE